ncbi:MAG: hypothetical protein SFV51_07830, partial [Bryobacteraceae bacterium]|nr:hypothetical protein [Bryobacteraceae bacterium]
TGNVLAHYGSAMAPSVAWQRTDWKVFHEAANWSRIREFTHTSPAEVVWEVIIGHPDVTEGAVWFLYGGDRIPSLLP